MLLPWLHSPPSLWPRPGIYLAAALLGCSRAPTITPEPVPEAIDASIAVATCGTLASLRCAEGQDPSCASRIDLAVRQHHVATPEVLCAGRATTPAALGVCGAYFTCSP